MLITKVSGLTGIEHTFDIPCTRDQLERWERGEDLIQRIMPNLTADEREFLITGSTVDEWDSDFGDEE